MGNRDAIAELIRHERADTLPSYRFTYEGHSGLRSDVVCAACLSKPEVHALYAHDRRQVADLKRNGERSIWHRPGELDALVKYELSCSCCGDVVESEESDDAYFAPSAPHDCGDHDCIKRRVPDAECELPEARP